MAEQSFRSGFVALVGRPNVGKSTLMNALLGQKVAIVTPKPQTTRDRILGIRTDEESQLVFLDTPGIHESKKAFNRAMVETALHTMAEADVVALLVDAVEQVRALPEDADPETLTPPEEDLRVLRFVREAALPTVLLVNKVDRVRKKQFLLPVLAAWQRQHPFLSCIPISALREEGLDDVVATLRGQVPEGPKYYEEDLLTDRSKRFLVAEIVREKLFLRTQREIPYAVAVEIERFERRKSSTEIHAAIHVERPSQKGIVVGRGGAMIKAIGTDARRDIEDLLGRKVMLRLFVHVEPDWTQKRRGLQRFGYLDE